MRVSVVVCTRNRPDLIVDCLRALSENPFEDCEILVVDQSTDNQAADVTAIAAVDDSRIRHIPTTTVGLSRARNIGIGESIGDVVAFTDDDCVPEPNWVSRIADEFDAHPEVYAMYGRSLPLTEIKPGERPVAVKADTNPRMFECRCNPWVLGHGCNMAFRREVFATVGLFDEALGPGGVLRNSDDADFTYRLLSEGFTARYSPEPLVYHQQFRHGEDLWKLEKDYGIGAGAFYSKHLKCGDMFMLKLILDRWCKAGGLFILYGLITWKRSHVRLGWYRIAYSALGMWMARRMKVSTTGRVYAECTTGGRS